MHENSLIALSEITTSNSKRARVKAIIKVLSQAKKPLRDWDILKKLFPDSTDLNLVRPRITEMYRHPYFLLIEGEKEKSHSGNRPVRTSMLVTRSFQLNLF
jgi:hypothetical protein